MQSPTNPELYSTSMCLKLHNWNESFTEERVKSVFLQNRVGVVSSLTVDSKNTTATVFVEHWFKSENGRDALYALTFQKFLDARLDPILTHDVASKSEFMLFTVSDDDRKLLQDISGPPGLRKRRTPTVPTKYTRQSNMD